MKPDIGVRVSITVRPYANERLSKTGFGEIVALHPDMGHRCVSVRWDDDHGEPQIHDLNYGFVELVK